MDYFTNVVDFLSLCAYVTNQAAEIHDPHKLDIFLTKGKAFLFFDSMCLRRMPCSC